MGLALLLGIEDGLISTESRIPSDSFFLEGRGSLIISCEVDRLWDLLRLLTELFESKIEIVW